VSITFALPGAMKPEEFLKAIEHEPADSGKPVQACVLPVPEEFDVFFGGGRGSAKSYALALLTLRHVEQYKAKVRCLYLRRTQGLR
jgi:hypothetical protein